MNIIKKISMMSSEFKPMGEFLLVKPDSSNNDNVTASGLIIARSQSVTDRPISGKVIACGSKCEDIKAGDYVVYPGTDGIDVKFLDSVITPAMEDLQMSDFVILRYASIIGKKA